MDKKKEKTVHIAPTVSIASRVEINREKPHVTSESTSSVDYGLGKYDVLTGRGSGSSQSEGNVAFRQVVFETYQEYIQDLDRTHRVEREQPETSPQGKHYRQPMNSKAKNLLAGHVLAKVRERKGRFLRRICMEDYRNLKPEDKAGLIRVFVFPWEEESSKMTGEQQQSSSQKQKGNEKSFDALSGAKVTPTLRENLYVELSPKDSIEKIKQALRFQVDRVEQQEMKKFLQQQSHLSNKKRSARKRLAIDQTSLSLVPVDGQTASAVAGLEMNCLVNPPKRLAASMGALRMKSVEALFGVSTAASAGFAASFAPRPFGKNSATNILASHRQLTGSPSYKTMIDCPSWPSSRPLKLDGISTAADSVDCRHNLQEQNEESLTTSVERLRALKERTSPFSPPKPSSFRSTTQLDPLAQVLQQVNGDNDLAALLRHQDLRMARSLLERFNGASYLPAVGDILGPSSLITNTTHLQSVLAQEIASRTISATYGFEAMRTLPSFAEQRLLCMPGTGLPTFSSTGDVLDRLLRQQVNVNTPAASCSPSNGVATLRVSNNDDSMPPYLLPSWFAISKTQRNSGEGSKSK